ncbi:hypothetical protein LJR230_001069 [Trinickia sp. LjRoot230]|uniref:hypothetical protein n=1 Tax=Trinickia sp. LjRoot230 TaxID=3342288 RepID=UPI003ECD2C56
MKALLMKLFRRRAEPAQTSEAAPLPAPASVPRKPDGKRKYRGGKRRHPAQPGARRINPDGPWMDQARGKR